MRHFTYALLCISIMFCRPGCIKSGDDSGTDSGNDDEVDSGDVQAGDADADSDGDADGSVDGSADTGCRWRKIYEVPGYLIGIWGHSSAGIFAAGGSEKHSGGSGMILHFDGASWSQMDIPEETCGLVRVWGSGDKDIFALGNDDGLILHFDGDAWKKVYEYPALDLSDIWGSSRSDVFAVGMEATQGFAQLDRILHYDGEEWSFMDGTDAEYILGIWGISNDDVYAVGKKYFRGGIILHYDGSEWIEMETDFDVRGFFDIAGFSSSEIFIVGDIEMTGPNTNEYNSGIMQYDGDSFVTMKDGIREMLNCIGGSSGRDIYAAGIEFNETDGTTPERSVIYHYDGSEWKAMKTHDTWLVNDIWTDSDQEAFAVGEDTANNTGVILHYSCQ